MAREGVQAMHTQDMAKDQMFKLRLDDKDRARLDAIAAHYEMTAAQTVRTVLKEKAIALGIDPPGLAVVAAARQGDEHAISILARRAKNEKAKAPKKGGAK